MLVCLHLDRHSDPTGTLHAYRGGGSHMRKNSSSFCSAAHKQVRSKGSLCVFLEQLPCHDSSKLHRQTNERKGSNCAAHLLGTTAQQDGHSIQHLVKRQLKVSCVSHTYTCCFQSGCDLLHFSPRAYTG
jgi:hypothetical protein